jgi:hypothetical protein
MADRDTHNAAALLNEADATGRKVPLDALLATMLNIADWQHFLAARDPDPVGRQRSAVIAAECERIMNRLRLKAEAIVAKRKAAAEASPTSRDFFVDGDKLPWPQSDPLLGADVHREAQRQRKATINERRKAIREVPRPATSTGATPAPEKLSTVKPRKDLQ